MTFYLAICGTGICIRINEYAVTRHCLVWFSIETSKRYHLNDPLICWIRRIDLRDAA